MKAETLLGMRVFISDLIPKIETPNKRHKSQRWDKSGAYHRRVQKKWNKRHGVHQAEQMLVSGGKIFASADMVQRMTTDLQGRTA